MQAVIVFSLPLIYLTLYYSTLLCFWCCVAFALPPLPLFLVVLTRTRACLLLSSCCAQSPPLLFQPNTGTSTQTHLLLLLLLLCSRQDMMPSSPQPTRHHTIRPRTSSSSTSSSSSSSSPFPSTPQAQHHRQCPHQAQHYPQKERQGACRPGRARRRRSSTHRRRQQSRLAPNEQARSSSFHLLLLLLCRRPTQQLPRHAAPQRHPALAPPHRLLQTLGLRPAPAFLVLPTHLHTALHPALGPTHAGIHLPIHVPTGPVVLLQRLRPQKAGGLARGVVGLAEREGEVGAGGGVDAAVHGGAKACWVGRGGWVGGLFGEREETGVGGRMGGLITERTWPGGWVGGWVGGGGGG